MPRDAPMPRCEKPTPQELQRLIEEHNISFEGPVPPSEWPAQYADVFRNIRNIGRTEYTEYKPNATRGLLTVAGTKKRVRELVCSADKCRKQSLNFNEEDWRGETEDKVLGRFAAEVVCQTCRKRFWISEFKASPSDFFEAGNLKGRRDRRTICDCNPLSSVDDDSDDASDDLLLPRKVSDQDVSLFASRHSKAVNYHPDDRLDEKGLHPRKPDRIFGLEMTKSLRRWTSSRPNLRYSPSATDLHISYPFLIIEAKSEKGSTGFQSIERQTAFPIRMCLKLQQDLKNVSGMNLHPLVWFMAFQGDDWHVYASICDDSSVQVIELWRGTILNQDHALQLFQIVDYICDWARDIYRVNIIRCLAGEEMFLRDITPAFTNISLQEGDPDVEPTSSASSTPRLLIPDPSPLIDLTLDEEMAENEGIAAGVEDEVMEDVHPSMAANPGISDHCRIGDRHPLLKFSQLCYGPGHWTNKATIRHANLVLFTFRHIVVPEERGALETFLVASGEAGGSLTNAQVLYRDLREPAAAVHITSYGLSQLEMAWTQSETPTIADTDQTLRAWVFFQTFFRREDWQIVRQLSCITFSPRAVETLATIALDGCNTNPGPVCEPTAHRCPCLVKAVEALRLLHGKDSAAGAMLGLTLNLELGLHGSADIHFQWARAQDAVPPSHPMIALMQTSNASPHLRLSSLLTEILVKKPTPRLLIAFLKPAKRTGARGALLLKKPHLWHSACPTYCLLVLKESDLSDEAELGDTILRVVEAREIFGVRGHGQGVTAIGVTDHACFKLWADILRRKVPFDVRWPI